MQTSDYLEQLIQDRDDLVDNLETKGITGLSGDETFTELVPEVLNIPSGGADLDDYFDGSIVAGGTGNRNNIGTIIKSIPDNITISGTSLLRAFQNCSSLTTIPLLDTSSVTNMSYMFSNCSSLTSVPLLDTSSVTNMDYMFSGCTSLTSVPLLDTSSVTNMSYMFRNCTSLTSIPVFNLSKATNLSSVMQDCTILTNDSLNNILASCISATSYTGTKTLKDTYILLFIKNTSII